MYMCIVLQVQTFVLIAIVTKCATQEVDHLSHLPD